VQLKAIVRVRVGVQHRTLEAVDEIRRRQLDDLQGRDHHDARAPDHAQRLCAPEARRSDAESRCLCGAFCLGFRVGIRVRSPVTSQTQVRVDSRSHNRAEAKQYTSWAWGQDQASMLYRPEVGIQDRSA